ncbi:hypothetical protein Cgig2_018069 [Carnegiea gigantea]|uniref:Uncharacterized protein n=1 Tax=Carnegiea gigantea TaxID=171969 RepID=A0A9Q1KAH2_9CARY|nr:hypothetical protein Cgig2_018069 [Carnegiea gigantea]
MVASTPESVNLYPVGRRYFSSGTGLIRVAMTFELGKWVLGPSSISKCSGAPGKTISLAMTSRLGSSRAQPLFLSTTLPEPLVSPSEEELVLEDLTSRLDLWETEAERGLTLESSGHLDLGHSAFLDIGHMGNSYVHFPWIESLLLNAKDTRSREIFAARPREGAGCKDRHCIRDFLRFPKLILSGNVHDHPTIN